ncbi:MAG: alpha/beta hydrolase [Anaerolineae bacterium]|nr:alpha/beta hydrolase [Anaerolineae bacterium]
MKTAIRILLFGIIALLLIFFIAPFIIPINTSGIAPATLVTDPDGAFISIQGVSTYYEDKGETDAPVLLFVHGLFGSTESWRYNVDGFVDEGYRVVTFDRPGFGLSDKPESFNYSVKNQTDFMDEFMTQLNILDAVIIGHSAGGNVATHFALAYPERVRYLILVDAAVLTGGPPAFVGGFLRFPPIWNWGRIGLQAVFTRDQLENNLKSFYVDPSFLTEADYDAYWRAFQTPNWDIGLLGLTRDSAGNTLSLGMLEMLYPETLIIWGDKDTVTPVADAERLATLIPSAELVYIPNTGHQPFEEAPQAFNDAIMTYLDGRIEVVAP